MAGACCHEAFHIGIGTDDLDFGKAGVLAAILANPSKTIVLSLGQRAKGVHMGDGQIARTFILKSLFGQEQRQAGECLLLRPASQRGVPGGRLQLLAVLGEPDATPPDGSWTAQVQLHHGYRQYLFLVDGAPRLDPNAHGIGRNERGERVSMIAVS